MIYIFDNSLKGLLTCVFEYFYRKESLVKIISQKNYVPEFTNDHLFIASESEKAMRVWRGLEKKLPEEWMVKLYCVFLSDVETAYQTIFDCMVYFFSSDKKVYTNYGNEHICELNKWYRKVRYEQHRMKGFIRFQKTKDNIFFAEIAPDHNVLPLISSHFKNRFADQEWIIYDTKRNYGLYFDLSKVEEIQLTFDQQMAQRKKTTLPAFVAEEQEALYETLWKDYFKSVNIKERKNMKLHTQFLPKRYWRYLTEK